MIVETRDNVVVRAASAAQRRRQQVLHVRPRSAELPLDESADRLDVPARAQRQRHWRPRTGTARCRGAAKALTGKRAFVLASPTLSNEALYLLSRIVEDDGRRRRVPRGAGRRGAAGGRRGPRAPRATAPPTSAARSCSASRAATLRCPECRRATRSSSPTTTCAGIDSPQRRARLRPSSCSGRRCRRGRAARPTSSCRSPTSEEEGTLHEPPRPRAAVPAGQGARRAWRGPRWYVLADLLDGARRADELLPARARCSRRSRRTSPAFAGCQYETLGFRGARSRPLERAR